MRDPRTSWVPERMGYWDFECLETAVALGLGCGGRV
uniref:Uncharacterized protein n=1 Tax=Arundo donax TaxID=35708 RepID=A0A0A9C776_ARUDO